MGKRKKLIIILSIVGVFILVFIAALARESAKDVIDLSFKKHLSISAVDGNKNVDSFENIAIDKKWTIKLSYPISEKMLRRFSLVDNTDNIVNVKFSLDKSDKSIVYMTYPGEGFEYGNVYKLNIKTVSSRRNIFLKNYQEMKFKTLDLEGRIRPLDGKIAEVSAQKKQKIKQLVIEAGDTKPVYAMLGGTVEKIISDGEQGEEVIIDHKNGLKSVYIGLRSLKISEKENIGKGMIIGDTLKNPLSSDGAKATCLTIELLKNNVSINPSRYLKYSGGDKYIYADKNIGLLSSAEGEQTNKILIKGKAYKVLEDEGSVYKVEADGKKGYIKKGNYPVPDYIPDNKIVIGWNYIGNKAANSYYYKDDSYYINKNSLATGVDVLSPTWFYITGNKNDAESINVGERGDKNYTKTAHSNGYQVWALLSNVNGENESVTDDTIARTKLLMSNEKATRKVADNLIKYAEEYDIDGINLDFEGFGEENKDLFTRFVKEVGSMLSEKDIAFSVDVTPVDESSVQYSMCYDRGAIAKYADYVVVMAYDEHFDKSKKPGSVASYPWVQKAVETAVKAGVPGSKLILGVPFYGRDFVVKDDGSADGSRTRTLTGIMNLENKYKDKITYDKTAKQYYISYTDNNSPARKRIMYIEDMNTLKWRTELASEYGLKGIAAWELYKEDDELIGSISSRFNCYLGEYRLYH